MVERDRETVVVTDTGGDRGGGGTIAAVALLLVVLVVLFFVFGGTKMFGGAADKADINVDVSAPATGRGRYANHKRKPPGRLGGGASLRSAVSAV